MRGCPLLYGDRASAADAARVIAPLGPAWARLAPSRPRLAMAHATATPHRGQRQRYSKQVQPRPRPVHAYEEPVLLFSARRSRPATPAPLLPPPHEQRWFSLAHPKVTSR